MAAGGTVGDMQRGYGGAPPSSSRVATMAPMDTTSSPATGHRDPRDGSGPEHPEYPEPQDLLASAAVRVDGDIDGVAALRRAVDGVSPQGVVRVVVQLVRPLDWPAGDAPWRLVDVVVEADGNLADLSLLGALAQDSRAAERVETALRRIEGWLDGHGRAGRDVTEIVLDADGAVEVTVSHGVGVAVEELAAVPPHPALHGAVFHITHRSPDLDALRDRLRDGRIPRVRRALRRLRLAVTRQE